MEWATPVVSSIALSYFGSLTAVAGYLLKVVSGMRERIRALEAQEQKMQIYERTMEEAGLRAARPSLRPLERAEDVDGP